MIPDAEIHSADPERESPRKQRRRRRNARPRERVKVTYADGSVQWKDARAFKGAKGRKKRPAQPSAYQRYLRSPEWRKRRRAALERDRHACQWCGCRYRLQVHHLTYERFGNERLEDLVTLCDDCHKGVHVAEREAA